MSVLYRVSVCALLSASLLLFNSPEPLAAQGCNGCYICAPGKSAPTWGGTYLEFSSCAPGGCDGILCEGGTGDDEDDEELEGPGGEEDVDELSVLMAQNGSPELLAFVASRSYVEYVPARNAFAVRGCNDALIALLPIPPQHAGVGVLAMQLRKESQTAEFSPEPQQ